MKDIFRAYGYVVTAGAFSDAAVLKKVLKENGWYKPTLLLRNFRSVLRHSGAKPAIECLTEEDEERVAHFHPMEVYNIAFKALMENGDYESAIDFLQVLIKRGFEPELATYQVSWKLETKGNASDQS